MKNNTYHTVGTFPKSNRKIVERGKTKTWTITFLAWYRHFNKIWRG